MNGWNELFLFITFTNGSSTSEKGQQEFNSRIWKKFWNFFRNRTRELFDFFISEEGKFPSEVSARQCNWLSIHSLSAASQSSHFCLPFHQMLQLQKKKSPRLVHRTHLSTCLQMHISCSSNLPLFSAHMHQSPSLLRSIFIVVLGTCTLDATHNFTQNSLFILMGKNR